MSFRKRKLIPWFVVLAVIIALLLQFFRQKTEVHSLNGKVDSLSVAIVTSSEHIEQLSSDSIRLSNEIEVAKAENERTAKENKVIKEEYAKRDEQARKSETQLKNIKIVLGKERKRLADYETQLATLKSAFITEQDKRKVAENKLNQLGIQNDSIKKIIGSAEIPKKNLDELRRQLSPRIAVLVGGLFEPNCESICNKVQRYLPKLTENEIHLIYGDEGKSLRKSASLNSCSPELLYLLARSYGGFNPPQSICPDQTKSIMKSTMLSSDFQNWCKTLFNCQPEEIASAKATILTLHNNFKQ